MADVAASGAASTTTGAQPSSSIPHTQRDWWVSEADLEGTSGSDAEDLGLQPEAPEFYDPNLDDKDEAWAVKQRQGRKSDAILSCPGCLTTVCIDCQQHHIFEEQFRAMFVLNCRVDTSEVVRPLEQTSRKRRRGKTEPKADSDQQQGGLPQGERYHPVLCEVCDSELGMRDADEVYHFFHVVASHA